MNPTTTRPDQGALLLLAGWLAAEALLQLLIATAALVLTATGWRPSPLPVIPRSGDPAPPDQGIPAATLEASTVTELRRLARAAGHRQLARSGRRADLLAALAAA